jgi:hypothetical protein
VECTDPEMNDASFLGASVIVWKRYVRWQNRIWAKPHNL